MEHIQIVIKTIDEKEILVGSDWSIDPINENPLPIVSEEITNILFDSIKNFIIKEKIKINEIKEILFKKGR